jgi:hypothetical protein
MYLRLAIVSPGYGGRHSYRCLDRSITSHLTIRAFIALQSIALQSDGEIRTFNEISYPALQVWSQQRFVTRAGNRFTNGL